MKKKDKVKYPAKFMIKIILDNSQTDTKNIKVITDIFDNLNIRYLNFTSKTSSTGKYISYSASITVETEVLLYKLYEEISKIENLKFAI